MDYDEPESVAQGNLEDIISYFECFMDDQNILMKEVEKIAQLIPHERKIIEIIEKCSKESKGKTVNSGSERLCGTLLVWLKNKPNSNVKNLKKFAEKHFNTKGSKIYDYARIVEKWEDIESLAKEPNKDADVYKMSVKALCDLLRDAKNNRHRTKLQWILLKLATRQGYTSWIPRDDRSKTHEGESLGSMSLEKLPSSGKYSEIEKNIKLIDVIWLENDRIFQIFKIGLFNKNKENFSSRFLEIADFSILTKIPFNLVVDEKSRNKVEQELSRPTFKEIRLSNRCFKMTAIKDWEEDWEKQNFENSKKK
jgi:hypothetical protein